MSNEVIGGKYGVVNGRKSVRNWSITEQQSAAKAVNSGTKNGTARRVANRSWSGSFGCHGAQPIDLPGRTFTFQGYTGPRNGVSGGTGPRYSGTAIVDSVAITWNWQSGEIINHTVNFSGHLALTVDNGAWSDTAEPDLPSICGMKVQYGSVSEAWTSSGPSEDLNDWPNVTQATLTISASNQSYNNSSTYIGGKCWTGKQPGPIDWTLSITEQNPGRPGDRQIGDDLQIRLFTAEDEYWECMWAHIEGYSNLNVDRETGAIIQRTCNMSMNGVIGGNYGVLTAPDGTTVWPE